ncbi:MAG: universal stress protein [Planctomycetota bacterium]
MEIFVATDLSDSGRAATENAQQWASKLGAGLTLLHVVPDPVLAPAFTDDVAGDVAKARNELEQIAAASPADVTCRVDVRTAEDVAAEIVSASKDADYVFVGTQGKSAFERLRLGSVATQVLRLSQVPVVCIPRPTAG